MPAKRTGVKVEGVRELQAALKVVGESAADMKEAHLAVATELVPDIRQRTPRRTGDLAASWEARSTKGRARISSPLEYAGIIEWGHPARGIEAASPVRDTIDASHEKILKTYEAELAKLSARAGFEVKP